MISAKPRHCVAECCSLSAQRAKGGRCTVCACQPRKDAECCSFSTQLSGRKAPVGQQGAECRFSSASSEETRCLWRGRLPNLPSGTHCRRLDSPARETLFRRGSHCRRRGRRVAEKTPGRKVLQIIRAAPRAEGTLSAPVSMQGAECCSSLAQRQGSKVQR